MKVIIAGPRYVTDLEIVKNAIDASGFIITQVVSGGARGVDTLGEIWAQASGIKFVRFPADWERYGKSAGPIRNKQMAEYSSALIAIYDGKSRGTGDMIKRATKMNLKKFIWRIE
jgi:hypothetical protein